MNWQKKIKRVFFDIWSVESNKRIIKDVLLFFVATVAFHFIYWNTNMDSWMFGPFNKPLYDFFRNLAFHCAKPFCFWFIDKPTEIVDTTFYFYHIGNLGQKIYDLTMEINVDCSGVKQLLQFLLIMLLCRGLWYKRLLYFLGGSLVILFFNVVRIVFLTVLFVYQTYKFQNVHDWVARPAMYVIIFGLWYIWVSCPKLSGKVKTNKT